MGLISVLWGVVAMIWMVFALIPVIGITNWLLIPFAAIGAIRSRSRSTPADLVTSENGCRASCSTSMRLRVMRRRRSASRSGCWPGRPWRSSCVD